LKTNEREIGLYFENNKKKVGGATSQKSKNHYFSTIIPPLVMPWMSKEAAFVHLMGLGRCFSSQN
jgi:hypothetical protein